MKTLQNVWSDLRPKEREFILTLVKAASTCRKNIHLGILPFLPIDEALAALNMKYINLSYEKKHFTGERFLKQLISKIQR